MRLLCAAGNHEETRMGVNHGRRGIPFSTPHTSPSTKPSGSAPHRPPEFQTDVRANGVSVTTRHASVSAATDRVSTDSFLIDGRQSKVTPDERLIVTRLVVGGPPDPDRRGRVAIYGLRELIESIVVAWSDAKIDPAVGLPQPPAACQSGSPSSQTSISHRVQAYVILSESQ